LLPTDVFLLHQEKPPWKNSAIFRNFSLDHQDFDIFRYFGKISRSLSGIGPQLRDFEKPRKHLDQFPQMFIAFLKYIKQPGEHDCIPRESKTTAIRDNLSSAVIQAGKE
jgi:hypothetical protein